MSVISQVLYPFEAKFDMDYYLKTHMPLVLEKWGPCGLKSYEVVDFTHGLNGLDLDTSKSPYGTLAILHWDNEDGMAKAVKSEPESKIFADVPNFSDKTPLFVAGKIVGTSSRA